MSVSLSLLHSVLSELSIFCRCQCPFGAVARSISHIFLYYIMWRIFLIKPPRARSRNVLCTESDRENEVESTRRRSIVRDLDSLDLPRYSDFSNLYFRKWGGIDIYQYTILTVYTHMLSLRIDLMHSSTPGSTWKEGHGRGLQPDLSPSTTGLDKVDLSSFLMSMERCSSNYWKRLSSPWGKGTKQDILILKNDLIEKFNALGK